MTEQQLVKRLKDTYRDKFPAPLAIDLLKWLSGYTNNQIDEIYEHYSRSENSKYPPTTVGQFVGLAREHGISKDDNCYYYRVCVDCEAIMNIKTHGCLECKSRNLATIASKEKKIVKPAKDHCYICDIYKTNPTGTSCNGWGEIDNHIYERTGERSISNDRRCNDCKCKFCCSEEFAVKINDQQRINSLSTTSYTVSRFMKRLTGVK